MTEKRTQAGWFGRQLARLRLAEPLRPRWWRFAPHALLAVALVPVQFFFAAMQNAKLLWHLDSITFVLFFALPVFLIPASLLRSLWLWLQLGSRRGAVWLLRPALLGLAFLVLISPIRKWGSVWDFERRLPGYNEVIPLLLQSHPKPLRPGESVAVTLPQGYWNLSHDGTAHLVGESEGMSIRFSQQRGLDIYVIGPRPSPKRRGTSYGERWILEDW